MAAFGLGGDLAFGPQHETWNVRNRLRKLSGQANQNIDDRIGIGEFARGISREQRDWANKRTRPIERSLSEILRKRLGPGGQDQLIADAQSGTGAAYDKSLAGAGRSAARYGVKLDPSLNSGYGIDRTKSMVEAGNRAAQVDRDAATLDASRFYQNGAGLPGMATQQYIAGAGSLADQNDYTHGIGVGNALGQIDAQHQLAMAFADGGEVGSGIGGRVLNGESKRIELESGDFIVPAESVEFYGREFWDKIVAENGGNIGQEESMETGAGEEVYADGGSVGDTVKLKNKHTEEYSTGMTDKQFGPWLEENGYEIGGDGQVSVKAPAPAQQPVERVRTPEFLMKPRANQKKPEGYAGGGGVGFGLGEGIRRGLSEGTGTLLSNVRTGLIAGLGESRRQQEHEAGLAERKEDRDYVRSERAYQAKQRELLRDADAATAQFVALDGSDLTPIINLQKKHGIWDGSEVVRNQDGKTYSVTQTGDDGSTKVLRADATLDDVRAVGMQSLQAMRDPKSVYDIWKKEVATTNTPYGGITSVYDKKSGKEIRRIDNNSDARAAGRGGRGADILGWKDHNQMNDDIQRLAYKRFAIPNPNGFGSILDPEGQQKAKAFKDVLFAELDKLGKSPRDITSLELNNASSMAETLVENEFRRRGAKGIKGSGKGLLNLFDADKAAADMAQYFPQGGSEPEMRQFMAQRDITDKADQDQVLAKMQAYTGASGGLGIGAPRQAAPAAAAPPTRTPEQVREDYRAGKLTRDQAKKELHGMGIK